MFILSLLASAVVAPLALVALVWLLGAYWPVGLLVIDKQLLHCEVSSLEHP